MANYPGAVSSFTTKNAGDTIQTSHVNALQDEIQAIEDGLLNGTAPVSASNATLKGLIVTGNSTLQNVQIKGNSTLASSITIGTQPYIFPAAGGSTGDVLTIASTSGSTMTLAWRTPGAGVRPCLVTHSAAIAPSSGAAYIGLNFDTETSDAGNMHSTASNSSRITLSQSTGWWRVDVAMVFSTTGSWAARIMKNDVTYIAGNGNYGTAAISGGAAAAYPFGISAIVPTANLTDYVTVQFATGTSSNTISSGYTMTATFVST